MMENEDWKMEIALLIMEFFITIARNVGTRLFYCRLNPIMKVYQ